MKALLASRDAQHVQLLFAFLKAFRTVFTNDSHPLSVAESLFQWVAEDILGQSRDALHSQSQDEGTQRALGVLLGMISAFGDSLFVGFGHAEVGVLIFHRFSLCIYTYTFKVLDETISEHAARY
jgi:hypothetical protein